MTKIWCWCSVLMQTKLGFFFCGSCLIRSLVSVRQVCNEKNMFYWGNMTFHGRLETHFVWLLWPAPNWVRRSNGPLRRPSSGNSEHWLNSVSTFCYPVQKGRKHGITQEERMIKTGKGDRRGKTMFAYAWLGLLKGHVFPNWALWPEDI